MIVKIVQSNIFSMRFDSVSNFLRIPTKLPSARYQTNK